MFSLNFINLKKYIKLKKQQNALHEIQVYNVFPDKLTSRELWNTTEDRLIKMKIKMQLIEVPINKKFHISPDCFEKIFPLTNKKSKYSKYVRLSEKQPQELMPYELITKNIFKGINYLNQIFLFQ